MIVFVVGTSLIPNNGSHTQNIPPTTSVKDSNVSSAAGIAFEPIEYKLNQSKPMFRVKKIKFHYSLTKKILNHL